MFKDLRQFVKWFEESLSLFDLSLSWIEKKRL